MPILKTDYSDYLHGGLLNERYLRVKGLNEGSFGIVSIAKDTKNEEQLVAIKYNTGKLSDFEAYQNRTENNIIAEVRSVSLNSKTKSAIKSDGNYTQTENSDKDVSKSVVLKETNQEILMLEKVDSHPNIISLLDHFDTYMVFEYAPRGDLHDAIQLGIAPVATSDVIDVFMQLISAVEFCHKNGVYHRDIKPENILIADDWSIKLTDFGLATDHLICTDFDVGSERYMAPELLEHSDIDSYAADKVDIWSLGVCLLNIVFGKSPFKSASSKDKMFLHFAANRETLFDIFPFMSYDLFSVMIHSLTIDPANRDLEMIKENLLNIDVLTYDYEFEEDYETVDDIKDKPLVEAIDEEEHSESVTIDNQNSKAEETTTDVSSSPSVKIENNDHGSINPDDTNTVIVSNNNKENIEPYKPPKLSIPLTTVNHDKVDSIDTILAEDSTTSKSSTYTVSKPINIQKKYEPPHKFLLNSLNDARKLDIKRNNNNNYNNNNNNNNNNTYHNHNNNYNDFRARRWNPAHRKPLKIANYNYRNKSQDGRIRGRNSFKDDSFDFNRKDFFTPRSVFTHYMEKANRGKQQLQQRGSYYKRGKDFETGSSNYTHHYNKYASNNNSNYYNYSDRRAWKKRKRRSSYAPNNNSNKNKGSYRSNNLKSGNRSRSRRDGLHWNFSSDKKKQGGSRRKSTGISATNNLNVSQIVQISRSLRSSMDGKYIPPNLRLNASHLMGSAILSDDETDTDIDHIDHTGVKQNYFNNFSSPRVIDDIAEDEIIDSANVDSEDDTFSFEFDQPTLSDANNGRTSINNINNPVTYKHIESNAINLLSKQLGESHLFDDKGSSSRDTSLTTTISNNYSSTGSNITGNSPKGYKKYIPPHHRRSSHSAACDFTDTVKPSPISNIILNHFANNTNNKRDDEAISTLLSTVSTSAPTKSTSFFNASYMKGVAPHEMLTGKGYEDFANSGNNDQYDDLFNIQEGKNYTSSRDVLASGYSDRKYNTTSGRK